MFETILYVSLVLVAFCISVAVYRVIVGPSTPDRVLALDNIGVNIIAGVAILSLLQKTNAYLEVILVIGILSFVGTIAFSRFIERGAVIEYKRD